jgi:membrane protein
LVVLVAATLIWLHGRALLTTTPSWSRWQPSQRLWVGSLAALYVVSAACVGAWIMAGRRYLLIIDDAYGRGRYPLITQMDDASGAVIGWAIASFVMLALLALTLPRQLVGPLPLALFGAIAVSLAANSYMARSLYAGVGRDHYIALLLMGTLIITNLVALSRLSGAGRAVSVLSGGVLFVATSTLVLCANQLLVNYGAWQQVEAQFAAAASGQSTLVEIPKTMPCNNVISYQWIDPPTSNVKHLRIFYGLSSKVQIKTVPQELTCGPATNR